MTNEELQLIDELSRKTLGSYLKKAPGSLNKHNRLAQKAGAEGDFKDGVSHFRKMDNREKGMKTAVDKLSRSGSHKMYKHLAKEELEQVDELTGKRKLYSIQRHHKDLGKKADTASFNRSRKGDHDGAEKYSAARSYHNNQEDRASFLRKGAKNPEKRKEALSKSKSWRPYVRAALNKFKSHKQAPGDKDGAYGL